MKKGQKVQTEFGPGTVVRREKETGLLSHRYIISFEPGVQLGKSLRYMHDTKGGLAFMDTELKPI